MTTEAAARLYEAEHLAEWGDRGYASFNPHNKPIGELPVIWGFNNGGSPGWYSAVLLADDGECLGGHICSSEAYMPHDLGIVQDSRPDRHEIFREHYPDGYRMDFVGASAVRTHPALEAAYEKHQARAALAKEGV